MVVEIGRGGEAFAADGALVRFLAAVNATVRVERTRRRKSFAAHVTHVRLLSCLRSNSHQILIKREKKSVLLLSSSILYYICTSHFYFIIEKDNVNYFLYEYQFSLFFFEKIQVVISIYRNYLMNNLERVAIICYGRNDRASQRS